MSDWSSDVCSSDLVLGSRHCERSEAIQSGLRYSGLLRFARNDDLGIRLPSNAIALRPLLPIRSRRAHREMRRNPSRSAEHTSELQSLIRISYAVVCF